MIDLVWLAAISNVLFAGLLAIAALVCSRFEGYTRLAHVMWMMVLVKLLTPPLMSVTPDTNSVAVVQANRIAPTPTAPTPTTSSRGEARAIASDNRTSTTALPPTVVDASNSWLSLPQLWQLMKYPATVIWGVGSLLIFGYSIYRMRQFLSLLAETEIEPTPYVQGLVNDLTRRLKVARAPTLRMTTARVSPMVLPGLRRPTLIVPISLTQKLTEPQLRLILAHELGHLRRGDHIVRLLEWFSWVVMWWNPLVWFAQRQLRECEEQSCDLFVLSTLKARAKQYAAAILEAVEAISPPVVRPPVMASAMNSGGTLERRMRKMLGTKTNNAGSWWKRLVIVTIAALILPLGIVSAADYQKVYDRLMKSVENGHLTEEQAEAMMIALKNSEGDREDDFDEEELTEDDLDRIGEKLKQMVADGELSEEEAWEKWKYLRRKANGLEVDEHEEGHEDHDEHFEEEDGDEEGFEEEEDEEWDEREEARDHARHELEGIELRLRLAVHEGEMTEEEAHRRFDEALEELGIEEEDDEEWDEEEHREVVLDELREHIIDVLRSGVSPERLEDEWDNILEEAEEGEEEEWEEGDEDEEEDEDWDDEEEDDFDDDDFDEEDEFEEDEEDEDD